MMLCVLLLCVVAACAGAGHHHDHGHQHDHGHHVTEPTSSPSPDPVTRSTSGQFHGSWMMSRKGRRFQSYRGIRYAQPPVGELRFQPPQMMVNYTAEVDARQEGPACPQPVINDYPVHEDCLRLNVYRPDGKIVKPLPVVVFMHAGGFYAVSGRSDLAGPSHLLDRDIVLVTINYRLGSLGFLSTGDKYAPGNNGFKDQVAALHWIQRNIAAFGGDPNLVTIAGYSAGSFSVMLHMVSPMSKGLFHRAISNSGSPISQIIIPRHQRHLAVKQATLLNCPTDSSKGIIDCLKTKSSKELGDSLQKMFEFDFDPVLLWTPVQEQDFGQDMFLPRQPLDALCSADLHAVPYIISQTHDEFFWKAFDVLKKPDTFQAFKDDWRRMAKIAFYLPDGAAGDQAADRLKQAYGAAGDQAADRLKQAYGAAGDQAADRLKQAYGAAGDQAADRLKQAYLAGKNVANDTTTGTGLGKLYSDAVIGFGVHRLVNLMARHSPKPVYYYEFGYIGNSSHYMDPATKKPIGAAHHDDLIYLFNVSYSFPSIPPSDSQDSQMVDKMTAIWYNFARYGDPNPKADTPELSTLSWPAFKPDDRKYLRIDKTFSLHQNLFEDRFKVWEELFPLDYQKCK